MRIRQTVANRTDCGKRADDVADMVGAHQKNAANCRRPFSRLAKKSLPQQVDRTKRPSRRKSLIVIAALENGKYAAPLRPERLSHRGRGGSGRHAQASLIDKMRHIMGRFAYSCVFRPVHRALSKKISTQQISKNIARFAPRRKFLSYTLLPRHMPPAHITPPECFYRDDGPFRPAHPR